MPTPLHVHVENKRLKREAAKAAKAAANVPIAVVAVEPVAPIVAPSDAIVLKLDEMPVPRGHPPKIPDAGGKSDADPAPSISQRHQP